MTIPQGAQWGAYALPFVGVGLESMGVPVPGETALVTAAVLAAHGHMSPIGVGIAAFAGAVGGDNLGYAAGRRWGTRLVHAPGIRRFYTAEKIAKADHYFTGNHAWVAVAGGRWVPLLRTFAGPLAGMHHMPRRTFVVANAAGAALWVGAVTSAAYFAGAHAAQFIHRVGIAGVVVAAALVAGYALSHLRHLRPARRNPTALDGATAASVVPNPLPPEPALVKRPAAHGGLVPLEAAVPLVASPGLTG